MEDNIVKQMQDAQLRILKEIDRVCEENGLEYCLAFGTEIGAIRHQGFIPWDDDIDIFMPVADVEKLDQAHELTVSQAQASAQTAAGKYAGGGFTGRFLNFEPSGTDWNAVADSVMRAQEEQERVPQES